MDKIVLKEKDLKQVLQQNVFNRVCEKVIYEDNGKYKIKNKGDKEYDTIDEAIIAVKNILD